MVFLNALRSGTGFRLIWNRALRINRFALSSGIPPQIVMKWTGHSDYHAMKPYIEIADKTEVDAMKLFDDELKK